MIEKWLYNDLINTSAIYALVGRRVFPLIVPQDTALPYVTYGRAGTEFDAHLNGSASDDQEALINVTAWSDTYAGAHSVGEAIQEVFHSSHDHATVDGVTYHVLSCEATNAVDEPPVFFEGNDTPHYGYTTTFKIRFMED